MPGTFRSLIAFTGSKDWYPNQQYSQSIVPGFSARLKYKNS
jgi:hypothetical protein